MKAIQSFLYISIFVLFTSCNKNSKDTSIPVLTLTSPASGQVYANGANVSITGTIADNGLHELKITITNTATGAVLYTKTINVHNLTSYAINESWVNNVAAITNATVKVEIYDLGNNHAEKAVQVVLNP